MAVSKAKKSEILESLKVLVKGAQSIGFTSNNGLSVEDITNLRVGLRESNSTITLAKKTLIKIAFKEVYNIEINDDLLPGQIALVCSNDDAIAGLGKVNDYIKSKDGKEKMEWTGSYFEEAIMDAEATKKIASMPSRETLLGRLVGSMQSPIAGLARFFDAASKELEAQGKGKISELKGKTTDAPAEVKVEEAPKVEEKATEAKVEDAPKVEVKAETTKTDDLTKVEGIGPKTAEALVAAGIVSYADLSKKTPEEVTTIISEVRGSHVTDTWPKQATMAAEGKWDELKKWQDEMDGGKPTEEK